jgi:serine/threonine protein kinase
MSPELINHKVYSKEIDVWSLGILLYEMIHGYSPFRPNIFENIKKYNLKFGKKISD